MKRLLLFFAIVECTVLHCAFAQQSRTFSDDIRSLQLSVDGNTLVPPILELGKRQTLSIEFDELSHDYHRYIYHVEHCNADWTVTEGIFESDFLTGFNDNPSRTTRTRSTLLNSTHTIV